MTQPDAASLNNIDALGGLYKNGLVGKIQVQVSTNLVKEDAGVQETLDLRQQNIINALVASGVALSDIEILPQTDKNDSGNTGYSATIDYQYKQNASLPTTP
ncbi:MAG: hypothetical protein JKY53_12465 [Flavobacteriales bacterium]|nr:hypothetical protein [Flavobacteriales bacterium]